MVILFAQQTIVFYSIVVFIQKYLTTECHNNLIN